MHAQSTNTAFALAGMVTQRYVVRVLKLVFAVSTVAFVMLHMMSARVGEVNETGPVSLAIYVMYST